MFVQLSRKRKLEPDELNLQDTAYDIRLLESYREDGKPRQRHIKGWTIRQSSIKFKSERELFLEKVTEDLEYLPAGQRKKVLADIRKILKGLTI